MMSKEIEFCLTETKKHIRRVNHFLCEFMDKLLTRGIHHDKSKLEDPELPYFVEYTPKLKGVTYRSDLYNEYMAELKVALDHHYAENDHHPEHTHGKKTVNGVENIGFSGMSLLSMTELLADWRSATERHDDGDILRSIDVNQERYGYSDEVKSILLNTVKEMGW